MRRRDNGTPIRTAMQAAGLDIKGLAAKTREIDPDGRGLGKTAIGYMTGTGPSAREEHSERAAVLVALALGKPVERLFHGTVSLAVPRSASTSRMQSEMQPSLEPLVDVKELNRLLGKSTTWVYRQRQMFPPTHATPFPVHKIGGSAKYRISEVLTWNALVYAPAAA